MRPEGNIRNNQAFSYRRLISGDSVTDDDFAHDGNRSVQLIIQGQILNVSERVETVTLETESIRTFLRTHTLTVFGLELEQESITQSTVISALRDYDEAIHRQAILIALANDRANRAKCLLNPKPKRSS